MLKKAMKKTAEKRRMVAFLKMTPWTSIFTNVHAASKRKTHLVDSPNFARKRGENLPGDGLERVRRGQLLALQQPLESLNTRLDLNTLVRRSPGGFRQRDASAVGNPGHQQRQ